MAVETLNKADFVAKIAADNQITKKVAAEALEIVISGVKDVLAENKTLRLTGFATFETVYQEEHDRKLGFTGETVTVPAGYRHKVKLAEKLKK
ncbi:HU family DNA-binding protein [Ligilactobacillus salivarius]|uniref:HU family DNA-binding protein n=1 Tax=Ligilactobacillus salivarius TaxID=1624 RepID=UPI0013704D44|nr:HU family DNA-binding protein [Ligilactobacillus salivarius]MYV10548.1 HU family DNA-binding protein [Ligilactobacillus salivarius]